MRFLFHAAYLAYLAVPWPRRNPPRAYGPAAAPLTMQAAGPLHPVTPRPAPFRPILSRPRATNDARLTRALIVNWYNHQDQAARAMLAAAGWPADGYVI